MMKFKQLLCKILKHSWSHDKNYRFIKNWERIKCKRCGCLAVLNHGTLEFLDWDQELEDCGNWRCIKEEGAEAPSPNGGI